MHSHQSYPNITTVIHSYQYSPTIDNSTIKTYTLLFLTFSVLVANPKKTTLHGAQSRSWSAEQGKENKRKSLAAYPAPHPPHCSFGENKENHATHLQALRRSCSVSRPYKDTFSSSTRPMGVASQNSTLPSTITSSPVSLLLSSPGDV